MDTKTARGKSIPPDVEEQIAMDQLNEWLAEEEGGGAGTDGTGSMPPSPTPETTCAEVGRIMATLDAEGVAVANYHEIGQIVDVAKTWPGVTREACLQELRATREREQQRISQRLEKVRRWQEKRSERRRQKQAAVHCRVCVVEHDMASWTNAPASAIAHARREWIAPFLVAIEEGTIPGDSMERSWRADIWPKVRNYLLRQERIETLREELGDYWQLEPSWLEASPKVDRRALAAMTALPVGDLMKEERNLLFTGPGEGKTLTASQMARSLVERGKHSVLVRYACALDMQEVYSDPHRETEDKDDYTDELLGCDVLVIDGLDAPPISKRYAERLAWLVKAALDDGPVLWITSRHGPRGLDRLWRGKDVRGHAKAVAYLVGALRDRFTPIYFADRAAGEGT